jgi:hypothetical protein
VIIDSAIAANVQHLTVRFVTERSGHRVQAGRLPGWESVCAFGDLWCSAWFVDHASSALDRVCTLAALME